MGPGTQLGWRQAGIWEAEHGSLALELTCQPTMAPICRGSHVAHLSQVWPRQGLSPVRVLLSLRLAVTAAA